MKSTMKSTFAIIAVVLMVLVAVVPMVGVFTAPSDAATEVITDPVEAEEINISLTVMLYDVDKTAIVTAGTNTIQIVYGKYTQTGAITTAADGVTFTIYELSVDKVTISYVDKDGKTIADYSSVTLDKLVAGKSYKADLIAGHYQQTATFKFAENSDITTVFMGTNAVEAEYEIFDQIGDEAPYTYKSVEKGKFIMTATEDSLTGKFLYSAIPAETTRVIVVSTFKAGSNLPITFDNKAYVAFNGGAVTFNAKETPVTVVADEDVHFPMEVTITGKKGDATATFKAIDKTIGTGAADKAYFTIEVPADEGAYNLSMKVTYNSTSDTVTGIDSLGGLATYAVNHAFFGRITMNTTYVQDGTLTAKVKSTESETATVSVNVKTTDGYFLVFNDKFEDTGAITDAKFKVGSVDYLPTGALYIDINDATDIALAYDGTYSPVTATLKLKAIDGTVGPIVVGKEVKVSGASTFGSLETDAEGKVKFMAETGKNIILSVDGASLSGDVSIVVGTDDEKTIFMTTQLYSIGVQDALGEPLVAGVTIHIYDKKTGGSEIAVMGAAEYEILTERWYGETRADIDLTKTFVTVAKDGYTFGDERIAFTKGLVVNAAEANYGVWFYKADGVTPVLIGNDDAAVYAATVYKNSTGDLIYTYDDTPIATPALGFITIAGKDLSLVSKKISDINEKPTDVYVIITADGIQTKGIFRDTYLVTVDDEGVCSIVSAYDSLSAKLTRIDEVTPISGIKVEITTDNFETVTDMAYTQTDGSFTLYSDVALADNANTKIRFGQGQATGYTFETSGIYDLLGEKIDVFTAAEDKYTFKYYDADGLKINTTGITKQIDGVDIPAAAKYDWEAGDEIQLTMLNGAKTYRTFETYTLTAADVSSGEITFVSEQSTYIIGAEDANGNALGGVTFTFYAQFDGVTYGNIPYGADPGIIPVVQADPTDELFGLTTVVLTDLSNADLAEQKVTGYAFIPTKAGYGFSATKYVDIVDDMTITAPNALLTYVLEDAAGNELPIAEADYAVAVFDGLNAGPAATLHDGYFTLIGSPSKLYTYTITNNSAAFAGYHFEAKSLPVLGAILANEQVVFGDIVDAAGDVLAIPAATTVKAYDILGNVIATSTDYVSAEHHYTIIVDVDEVAYYKPTANIVIDGVTYTFTGSVSPYIYANEQTVDFSAITANGHDLVAAFENTKAFDSKGVKIGSSVADGVVVDVDEVAYFQADVTVLGYTFAKQSATPVFVANESYITGSVPYTGKAGVDQAVELDFYLEGKLVDWKMAEDVEGYEYNAIVDLSSMVVDGVAFDSIAAVYTENGVVIASGVIDPTTPVNNIISPTVEIYVAELLAPSALIANHVAIEQIGVTVTVTADSNFMIADDEGVYTDGQYTYTFAGWYVDNQKVSTSPVFTFELTDDVVISPQYTVTYEKTSDANDKQTPQPQPVQPDNSIDTNVLIIGICAVIVALIAVVYAVIKKE